MTYSSYGYFTRLREMMEQADDTLQSGQADLRTQMRTVVAALHDVALTLGVTMETLQRAGLLDPAAIAAEVAKLKALPPTVTGPCVQCGKVVAAADASSTPMGMVCRACAGG